MQQPAVFWAVAGGHSQSNQTITRRISMKYFFARVTVQGKNTLNSQFVTVDKRLFSRAFISYEHGITAVSGIIKLDCILTPCVKIVTQAGMDNAIDIFYTFSFK